MNRTAYISGFRKWLIDIAVFVRFFIAVVSYFGFFKGVKNLRKYLSDKNNLFLDLPNRYVKNGKDIFVVPDVPPLNTKDFINYLIKDIEVLIEQKKAPLLFGIICISSVCPYKCSYCYNISEHSDKQILSSEKIFRTIEELIQLGVKNIYMSGGEPMVREEIIYEILQKFASANIGFWLITTGWGLDEGKANKLKSLGLRGMMISLDAITPEYINNIKKSSAFETALKAIKSAHKANIIVVADCVINRFLLSDDNFSKYATFAKELGVNFINCYAPRTKDSYPDENLKLFTISELQKIGTLARVNQTSAAHLKHPLAYSPDDFEAKRGCMGGKLFFYISPDGNVKACPFQKSILGNINTLSLTEIIQNYEKSGCREVCQTNLLLSKMQKY